MDRDAALQTPSENAGLIFQSEYRATDRISGAVVKHIRDMGWDAEAAIHSLIQVPEIAGLRPSNHSGRCGALLDRAVFAEEWFVLVCRSEKNVWHSD